MRQNILSTNYILILANKNVFSIEQTFAIMSQFEKLAITI